MRITTRPPATTILLAAAALLVASCGGSSSSEPADSTKGAAPPSVGDSVHMAAGQTTLVVQVGKVIFPLRGSGMLLSPGDAAAGVEVAVKNSGHAVYDSSSESDISLRTTSGADAEPGFAQRGQCATTELDFLKEVQPGESRSGCVAYDVPKGAKPASVRFAPEGRGGQTWLVAG